MIKLPSVPLDQIPETWRRVTLPLSNGQEVLLYRGFASHARARLGQVIVPGDIGGVLSRRIDAAHDAIFNQYGRDPVLEGADAGGVVQLRIPALLWDQLVRTHSISERANYPGFSRRIQSTEIRVNSREAAVLINGVQKSILPPDAQFDFRNP